MPKRIQHRQKIVDEESLSAYLKLRRQIGSFFTRSRYALRSLTAFDDADIIGLDKIDGLDVTEPDTLGIAVANVAFENPPVGGIETHGPEWTDADTGTAADTGIIINRDPTQRLIL